jgi:hypothetical protein
VSLAVGTAVVSIIHAVGGDFRGACIVVTRLGDAAVGIVVVLRLLPDGVGAAGDAVPSRRGR